MSQSRTSSLADLLDQLEGKVSHEILEEVRNFAFVVETSPRDELPLLLVQLEALVSITSDRIEMEHRYCSSVPPEGPFHVDL